MIKHYLVRKNREKCCFELLKSADDDCVDVEISGEVVYEAEAIEQMCLFIAISNIAFDEIELDDTLSFDEMLIASRELCRP